MNNGLKNFHLNPDETVKETLLRKTKVRLSRGMAVSLQEAAAASNLTPSITLKKLPTTTLPPKCQKMFGDYGGVGRMLQQNKAADLLSFLPWRRSWYCLGLIAVPWTSLAVSKIKEVICFRQGAFGSISGGNSDKGEKQLGEKTINQDNQVSRGCFLCTHSHFHNRLIERQTLFTQLLLPWWPWSSLRNISDIKRGGNSFFPLFLCCLVFLENLHWWD